MTPLDQAPINGSTKNTSHLDRPGVLNEIEETLSREARDGGNTYLIPVRLDDYVLNGWQPKDQNLARTIRERVVVDFSRHEESSAFGDGVSRLIGVLKKPRTLVHM